MNKYKVKYLLLFVIFTICFMMLFSIYVAPSFKESILGGIIMFLIWFVFFWFVNNLLFNAINKAEERAKGGEITGAFGYAHESDKSNAVQTDDNMPAVRAASKGGR